MKIHIVGASGSGVTSLGHKLSQELNVSYFDSDDFFWLSSNPPFTHRRDPEMRNKMIFDKLKDSKDFILGGSIIDWGKSEFFTFDLIVFLYLPEKIRIERLKSRELERYGAEIASNPEREKQYQKFILWASDYDHNTGIAARTLQAHKNWLSDQNNAKIVEIAGDIEIEAKVKIILEVINDIETTAYTK